MYWLGLIIFIFFFFASSLRGAVFLQSAECIVELAIVAAFVTAEEVRVTVSVAEREECAQSLAGRIFAGVRGALAASFIGEADGFEGPDAKEPPVGDGHLFDEEVLDIVLGIVFGVERVEKRGEASAGFVGEKDGLEEEGLAAGVTASGFGGVGTVGGMFAIGDWHTKRIIREGCKGKYVKLLILLKKSVELRFIHLLAEEENTKVLLMLSGCFFNGATQMYEGDWGGL